jgi:hypothetical protein
MALDEGSGTPLVVRNVNSDTGRSDAFVGSYRSVVAYSASCSGGSRAGVQ